LCVKEVWETDCAFVDDTTFELILSYLPTKSESECNRCILIKINVIVQVSTFSYAAKENLRKTS
jgi:hypothetical protein